VGVAPGASLEYALAACIGLVTPRSLARAAAKPPLLARVPGPPVRNAGTVLEARNAALSEGNHKILGHLSEADSHPGTRDIAARLPPTLPQPLVISILFLVI
jgi:hypothetical protein